MGAQGREMDEIDYGAVVGWYGSVVGNKLMYSQF